MSGWFDTKSFTSLAKSALSQAQKQLDKALEAVQDEESDSDNYGETPSGNLIPSSLLLILFLGNVKKRV